MEIHRFLFFLLEWDVIDFFFFKKMQKLWRKNIGI